MYVWIVEQEGVVCVLCLWSSKSPKNEEEEKLRAALSVSRETRNGKSSDRVRFQDFFKNMSADAQIDEAFELFDREAKGTLTYNNAKTVRVSFFSFQTFTPSLNTNDSLLRRRSERSRN